ncbi:Hypothetical predicted protein [Octopus vulgaris]|uniref:Uncharacterized protein n=1 Tax=Octopus vulgaris TaxID=6645 RepID=A0AA36ANI5_OCTVU|nr:Hypothetical predicted protein [Octopus vulgaris]
MSDEFVEYMEDSFGVRMDMDGLRIGNEHSGDSENKRTGVEKLRPVVHRVLSIETIRIRNKNGTPVFTV